MVDLGGRPARQARQGGDVSMTGSKVAVVTGGSRGIISVNAGPA